MEIELTRERYRELALTRGDEIFITPTAPKVFDSTACLVEDYAV